MLTTFIDYGCPASSGTDSWALALLKKGVQDGQEERQEGQEG